MAINEFEDNVHQNLEGLLLKPSAAVWDKVEGQIKKEKKRRMLLFLLLSFFVFFVGGLFWMNAGNKQSSVSLIHSNNATVMSSKKEFIGSMKNPQTKKANLISIPGDISITDIKAQKIIMQPETKAELKIKQQNSGTGIVAAINKLPKKLNTKSRIKYTTKAADIDEVVENDNRNKDFVIVSPKTDSVKNTEAMKTMNDSSKKITPLIKDTSMNKPNEKQIVKNKQTGHKWTIGFSFDIGSAATPNAYSNFYNTAGPIISGTGGGTNSVNSGRLQSSAKLAPGIGFSIGVFAARKISAKTNISLGLNYRLFSTDIKSNGIDSIAFNRYQSFNHYHNYFHFIEMPIEIQSKITGIKKLPLYWSAGILFSELVGAKALQFDKANGLYYSDNSLFNKTGLGLSAGLFFTIKQNWERPLQIGPDFYYTVTAVSNSGIYNQAHYKFIGIRIRAAL